MLPPLLLLMMLIGSLSYSTCNAAALLLCRQLGWCTAAYHDISCTAKATVLAALQQGHLQHHGP
jgi:hypothetical protein